MFLLLITIINTQFFFALRAAFRFFERRLQKDGFLRTGTQPTCMEADRG